MLEIYTMVFNHRARKTVRTVFVAFPARWLNTALSQILRCIFLKIRTPGPFTHSPSSRHPPFTQYPLPTRSLVRGDQSLQFYK